MLRLCAPLLWLIVAAPAFGQHIDFDLLDRLYAEHTRTTDAPAGVVVDYASLKGDPDWAKLIASYRPLRPFEQLKTRPDLLAFWINAYNVFVIQTVVENYPVKDIRDIGTALEPVWRRPAGIIGRRRMSLDQIEYGVLRKLRDARVHAAMVCASTSCPPLLRKAYRPETINEQLDEACANWLASSSKGVRIDRTLERMYISKIFDWFETDFGGRSDVLAFVHTYSPKPVGEWLSSRYPDVHFSYLEYDWALNDYPR